MVRCKQLYKNIWQISWCPLSFFDTTLKKPAYWDTQWVVILCFTSETRKQPEHWQRSNSLVSLSKPLIVDHFSQWTTTVQHDLCTVHSVTSGQWVPQDEVRSGQSRTRGKSLYRCRLSSVLKTEWDSFIQHSYIIVLEPRPQGKTSYDSLLSVCWGEDWSTSGCV